MRAQGRHAALARLSLSFLEAEAGAGSLRLAGSRSTHWSGALRRTQRAQGRAWSQRVLDFQQSTQAGLGGEEREGSVAGGSGMCDSGEGDRPPVLSKWSTW